MGALIDRIRRWFLAAVAEIEELHRDLHARHTRAVREAIPYRDIRAALFGQIDGPYR